MINQAALEAGKHVYCEKPLAMSVREAERLVSLAEEKGLTICGAPANALSDAFQLAREQIQTGRIGQPRLVAIIPVPTTPQPTDEASLWEDSRAQVRTESDRKISSKFDFLTTRTDFHGWVASGHQIVIDQRRQDTGIGSIVVRCNLRYSPI
nr:Gfo/Idh/MocA family oxidoreductase [Nitratireductor basaltis]